MRIAIVARPSHSLPTSEGMEGTWAPGLVMAAQTEMLRRRGHEVRLYAAAGSRVEGGVRDLGFAPFYSLPTVGNRIQMSIRRDYYINEFMAAVIRDLRSEPVDIIHLHDYRDLPLFKAAALPAKVIATIHGDYEYNLTGWPESMRPVMSANNLLALVAPNDKAELAVQPVGVVANPVDIEQFQLIEQPKDRLVYVGRLGRNKGAHLLPQLAKLTGRQIDVYGASFEDDELKAQLEEAFSDIDNLSWKGHLDHDHIHEAFDAQALLFPITRPEGFPLVVLEAMASGTPTIGFDIGTLAKIVDDGSTGYVIAPDDVEAMAKAVQAIGDLDRRACRRAVETKYGEDQIYHSLLAVYNRMIQGSDHSAS